MATPTMQIQRNEHEPHPASDDGRGGGAKPDPVPNPRRPNRAHLWRNVLVSVLINAVAPLVLYDQLRHRVGSTTTALIAAAGVPLLWTAGRLVMRRRLDPIGLLSLAGFALGILLVLLTGGNPLVFKIREAVLTGVLGLVCLGSIVVRHPIGLLALRRSQTAAPEAALRHAALWITAIAGVTLVAHAAVSITLAVVLPTTTFLAVHQLVGLGILALGVLALMGRKRFLPAPPADDEHPDR
jgi:drug/metabolite transporter (DMT)-like permease